MDFWNKFNLQIRTTKDVSEIMSEENQDMIPLTAIQNQQLKQIVEYFPNEMVLAVLP